MTASEGIPIGQRLDDLADADPQRTAVVIVHRDGTAEQLTRRELNEQARRWARALAARGVGSVTGSPCRSTTPFELVLGALGAWEVGRDCRCRSAGTCRTGNATACWPSSVPPSWWTSRAAPRAAEEAAQQSGRALPYRHAAAFDGHLQQRIDRHPEGHHQYAARGLDARRRRPRSPRTSGCRCPGRRPSSCPRRCTTPTAS